MEKNIITQYFEEVETTRGYNGYFCSVAEAVIGEYADYLLCAKENQETLKKDIEDYVQDETFQKEMEKAGRTGKT